MAVAYIKKYPTERLKLAINASQERLGVPLPFDEVQRLALEFDVRPEWVRRVERRRDLDLQACLDYRRQMELAGVDVDSAGGLRVGVGGKKGTRAKATLIRERLFDLMLSGEDIDFLALNTEFELPEKSLWVKQLHSQILKDQAAGEKRPVTDAQKDLLKSILRGLGGQFSDHPGEVTRHDERLNKALSRLSLAQVHKAIKILYYVVKVVRSLRSGFGIKVVKPLLDAIEFKLFR